MCLQYKTSKKYLSPTARKNLENHIGYKAIYEHKSGVVQSQMADTPEKDYGAIFKKNRWVKDKATGSITGGSFVRFTYKKGFHISLTKPGAKEFLHENWYGNANCVYRVKFKAVIALGKQSDHAYEKNIPIVVSKDIILKERIK